MTFEEAKAVAQVELDSLERRCGSPLAFRMESTIEKPRGWAFFYNTVRFIETGEARYRLAGNGPIVVRKDGGSAIAHGPMRIEEVLASLEEENLPTSQP